MKTTSFALLAVSTIITVQPVGAALSLVSGPITNPANGHDYYLLSNSGWNDAEQFALTFGGHLATVRNQAENDWIFSTFANYGETQRFLWIGLNDAATEGTYVWASGETPGYVNWGIGEPNNLTPYAEDYVQMFGTDLGTGYNQGVVQPGTWNDIIDSPYPYEGNSSGNNFGPVFGVMEVVPEPTPTLCGVGLVAICVLRFVRSFMSRATKLWLTSIR